MPGDLWPWSCGLLVDLYQDNVISLSFSSYFQKTDLPLQSSRRIQNNLASPPEQALPIFSAMESWEITTIFPASK